MILTYVSTFKLVWLCKGITILYVGIDNDIFTKAMINI